MKKVLFTLATAALFFGCSDDSSTSSMPKTVDVFCHTESFNRCVANLGYPEGMADCIDPDETVDACPEGENIKCEMEGGDAKIVTYYYEGSITTECPMGTTEVE